LGQVVVYNAKPWLRLFIVNPTAPYYTVNTMGIASLIVAALAAVAVSKPIPDPVHIMGRAGPAAGQVITKCNAPGQLALAYDDGPYQYTQKLVDTLTAGGAKGTFFVTGKVAQ
jgi:hypothetical protein